VRCKVGYVAVVVVVVVSVLGIIVRCKSEM